MANLQKIILTAEKIKVLFKLLRSFRASNVADKTGKNVFVHVQFDKILTKKEFSIMLHIYALCHDGENVTSENSDK